MARRGSSRPALSIASRAGGAALLAGLALAGCVLYSLFAPEAREGFLDTDEMQSKLKSRMNRMNKQCADEFEMTPDDRKDLEEAFDQYDKYKEDDEARAECRDKIESNSGYLRLICKSSGDERKTEIRNAINNVC
jgi:Spy/CpxP family protein refolding chaperone